MKDEGFVPGAWPWPFTPDTTPEELADDAAGGFEETALLAHDVFQRFCTDSHGHRLYWPPRLPAWLFAPLRTVVQTIVSRILVPDVR